MYIHESEAHKYISPGHVKKGERIIELKVLLMDTNPEIWRKIAVPTNFTLEQLGRVAACAVGWIPRYFNFFGQDGEFIQGYDPYMPYEDQGKEEMTEEPKEKKVKRTIARNIIISSLFADKDSSKRPIIMDYGSDGWLHEISLVNLREADRKCYPKCIDGKNACPPEDCNGPEGYESLLIALKDPKHEDHKDMKEWLDDSGYKKFNPKKFSVSKAVISD